LKDIFKSLIHAMPVAVHVADPVHAGQITGVSRGWEELTGYKASEIEGKSFIAISLQTDDELQKRVNGLTETGAQVFQGVVTISRCNGVPLSTVLHITPFDICSQTFLVGVLLAGNNPESPGTNGLEESYRDYRTPNFSLHSDTVVRQVHSSIRHWLQRRCARSPFAFAIPSQSAKGVVRKFLPSVEAMGEFSPPRKLFGRLNH